MKLRWSEFIYRIRLMFTRDKKQVAFDRCKIHMAALGFPWEGTIDELVDALYEVGRVIKYGSKTSPKVQFNKICRNTDPGNVFAFLDYVQDKHHG